MKTWIKVFLGALIIVTVIVAIQHVLTLEALDNDAYINTRPLLYEEYALTIAWFAFAFVAFAMSGTKKKAIVPLTIMLFASMASLLPQVQATPDPYPNQLNILALFDGDLTFPFSNFDTIDYYIALGSLITYFREEFGVKVEFTVAHWNPLTSGHTRDDQLHWAILQANWNESGAFIDGMWYSECFVMEYVGDRNSIFFFFLLSLPL